MARQNILSFFPEAVDEPSQEGNRYIWNRPDYNDHRKDRKSCIQQDPDPIDDRHKSNETSEGSSCALPVSKQGRKNQHHDHKS